MRTPAAPVLAIAFATATSAMAQPVLDRLAWAASCRRATDDPALLAFYPSKAREDGVDGTAQITCQHTQHLRLEGCTLLAEDPEDYGFGEAALAIAAESQENPHVNVDVPPPRNMLTFHFSRHPPSISPNTIGPVLIISNPDILTAPSGKEVQDAYPQFAQRYRIPGHATLRCAVSKGGGLYACSVTEETPPDQGFADAALQLTPDFVMRPGSCNGNPLDGAVINIPFKFQPWLSRLLATPRGRKRAANFRDDIPFWNGRL